MDEKQSLGFFQKLQQGLSKTRKSLLSLAFGRESLDKDFYDELEEALIIADVGAALAESLIIELRERVRKEGLTLAFEARDELRKLIAERMQVEGFFLPEGARAVLLIVGVNGVGKTTSIGKLAYYYKTSGRAPMLAAADTFRAAAAEQLGIWAERAGVPMVRHEEGSDPAAVVFDAIASFKAKRLDVLICDTAGRLHNKKNLMNELEKIRRVIDREIPDALCKAVLVLDSTTGRNAIMQAKAFSDAVGLTDVILTKLDGTAKGGMAIAVKEELGLPVRFVGVGEGLEDLQPFDADAFAAALLLEQPVENI
ncbi:MAG TPA: signal recognition particle-docking protein FtsY [Clostridia bacterium]|nr:MAG: Signal recognition particle receptor FtsY [Firmicutes bacterium ADurb.Bin356]HOF94211.1 signal recognition particle-docking protein FtsY [Clostridia bacterium]HOR12560.1 signal recognition particle-docking protein FtsY [Clostridia bacterium]